MHRFAFFGYRLTTIGYVNFYYITFGAQKMQLKHFNFDTLYTKIRHVQRVKIRKPSINTLFSYRYRISK